MIEEWKEYYHDFAGGDRVAYLVVGFGAVAGVAAGDEAQRRGAETVEIHIQGLLNNYYAESCLFRLGKLP